MNRREFIAVLAAAAGWPLAGRAQQPERVRRVGVLMIWRETDPVAQASMTALARALEHFGWVAGKNIRIDYRFAAGDAALFKTYADELVGLMPDAILASTPPAVAALREQTRTIPIVFVLLADPVGQGFVHNLARPGGNVTGFSSFDAALMGKWLQLLKEVAPGLTRVTAIFNPATAPYAFFNREIEAAGTSLRMTVRLDENCGADGWAMTPSGTRGVLNDAMSIYFLDATLASAFVARWCAGYKVETAEGVFRIRADEPSTRTPASLHRTP